VVLASYVPVSSLLLSRGCKIIIVSTSSPKYSASFADGLGFPLPGTVVVDTKRLTHRATMLKASIFASLVMPFKKHLSTFGGRALAEALRVSLLNATAGHGSSWQQGATIVLRRATECDHGVRCVWAWREDFPGDWLPVQTVLQDALGIADAPQVSYPERLEYVIACRNGRGGGSGEAGRTDKRPLDECTDDACSLSTVRRKAAAAMARDGDGDERAAAPTG